MPGEAWATPPQCAKVKAHTTPEAVLAGVIAAGGRPANDLAVQLASWWFSNTVPRRTSGRRGSRPTWPSHAWLTGLRALVLRDSVWTLTRPGSLGVDERMRGGMSAHRPWSLPLPALPAIQRGGHTFVHSASGRVCSLCQHPERTTCGRCPGASGARARGAALQFQLDGSAGHRIVDLLQGGRVVSVLCTVCGSYGDRMVRRSLLSNCLGACATCCWLSRLAPSALHVFTVFVRKLYVPGVVHVAPGTHFLRFCPAPACAGPAQAQHFRQHRRQWEFHVSCRGTSCVPRRGLPPTMVSPPGQSNMWCPLLETAYHHSIGAFLEMSVCHSSKAALSQSCHFALFVNPVARSSTDEFTLCDVHPEHERTSPAACLQRRHELLPLPQEHGLVLLQESCGSDCRSCHLSRGRHLSMNVHRTFHIIPYHTSWQNGVSHMFRCISVFPTEVGCTEGHFITGTGESVFKWSSSVRSG